jgi:hypothetical protein
MNVSKKSVKPGVKRQTVKNDTGVGKGAFAEGESLGGK